MTDSAAFTCDSAKLPIASLNQLGMPPMSNTFTAILERDGDWYVAYCPEVPGANGQGRSKQEARGSLAEAIELIFLDRREDAFRGLPEDAERDTVAVG